MVKIANNKKWCAVECVSCAAGTYQSGTGATTCIACASGFYSMTEASSCAGTLHEWDCDVAEPVHVIARARGSVTRSKCYKSWLSE